MLRWPPSYWLTSASTVLSQALPCHPTHNHPPTTTSQTTRQPAGRKRPGWRSGHTALPYRPRGWRRLCTATSTALTWVRPALPWLSGLVFIRRIQEMPWKHSLLPTLCQGLTHPQTFKMTPWGTQTQTSRKRGSGTNATRVTSPAILSKWSICLIKNI